jgi:cytochrome c-type biogenesis protein
VDGENVTLFIAFGAGVLSFASPCVLPLVPAYIGHMVTVSGELPTSSKRGVCFLHAASFVTGFSLVFVVFWTSIGLIGFLLLDNARYLREAGGAILIFMGLHVLGVINIGFMNQEYSVKGGWGGNRAGYPRSLVMGMVFAAGWTPCIGPVLGSIIGLAIVGGTVAQGAVLLLAYSAGLGIPFLVTALAVDSVSAQLKRLGPVRAAVPVVSGVLVVAVGVLMLTNSLIKTTQFFDWGYV